MKIREHVYAPNNFCLWCGAIKTSADVDERTCVERDNGTGAGELRPVPARRLYASEDWDSISLRIAQIREYERPACPIRPHSTLHDCLRTAARCQGTCPHRDDWVGPNEEGLR